MSGVAIDKKIANYVEQLNARQKKIVLSVAKAFAEDGGIDDKWNNDAFIKELDKRTGELESGKIKGYTWDEVKKITRKSLSEMKKK